MRYLVAGLLLTSLGFGQAAKPVTVPAYVPRFQIVQTKVLLNNAAGTKTAFDVVLLLDSQTGQVWEFNGYEEKHDERQGGTIVYPSHFEVVFVEGKSGNITDYKVQKTFMIPDKPAVKAAIPPLPAGYKLELPTTIPSQ